MAQPIDDRVLLAAQRAIARARGQEFVTETPAPVSPSAGAKLYRITDTAELEPISEPVIQKDDKSITSPQRPIKTTDHQRRNWLSGKNAEQFANVVVPRGYCSATTDDVFAPIQDEAQAEAVVSAAPEAAVEHAMEEAPASAQPPVQEEAVDGISDKSLQLVQDYSQVQVQDQTCDQVQTPVEDKPQTDPRRTYEVEEEYELATEEIPYVTLRSSTFSVPTAEERATAEANGLFLDHFFAQLKRCGVHNIVVTPGSRSTPLAMKAYETFGDVHMNIDERSAAFYALGIAKATGNVVAVICTSGSAVANLMPAVLEAEAARVPILLLTADKPAYLQGHGAIHATDQLHFFGPHVKSFIQMPLPSKSDAVLAFAQQTAIDACIAAHGMLPNVSSADAGPVHVNFPFEKPLTPPKRTRAIPTQEFPAAVVAGQGLMTADAKGLLEMINGKRVMALVGEGACGSNADARQMLDFAHTRGIPLFADPLSGLRSCSDSMIIDCYDAILGGQSAPHAEVVIRFGRWPVSSRLVEAVKRMGAVQIVVDPRDTRDVANATDIFVRCAPTVFCESLTYLDSRKRASRRFYREWRDLNELETRKVSDVRLLDNPDDFEGAYVYEVLEGTPENSLIWCANSLSMAALDTFYRKSDKRMDVMCNRGLAGMDGTLSSAFGAAQAYDQTTVIAGDIATLRDLNALSLQSELRVRVNHGSGKMPSITVVLLNNNGAGFFDTMPMKSDEPYYERLFLNPQSVDFKRVADAFGVTFRTVSSVNTFRRTYASLLGEPGINILEVLLPLAGVKDRYANYWKI